jgi:hypothetical protein
MLGASAIDVADNYQVSLVPILQKRRVSPVSAGPLRNPALGPGLYLYHQHYLSEEEP